MKTEKLRPGLQLANYCSKIYLNYSFIFQKKMGRKKIFISSGTFTPDGTHPKSKVVFRDHFWPKNFFILKLGLAIPPMYVYVRCMYVCICICTRIYVYISHILFVNVYVHICIKNVCVYTYTLYVGYTRILSIHLQ